MKDLVFMTEALHLANYAKSLGEVPVGALVVYEGQIIGRGYNLREEAKDPLAHAEILAIAEACETLGRWRLNDCTLYVTLEPCPMCAGAIVQARLKRLVFSARDPKAGAVKSLYQIATDPRLNHQLEVCEGVLEKESSLLLKQFFLELRNRQRSDANPPLSNLS